MTMVIPPTAPALALPEAERRRQEANRKSLERMVNTEPVLIGVAPAGEVVPGMTPSTILTSGAPLEWHEYTGGQRRAIIFAAIHEGLAPDEAAAEESLASGRVRVRSTQQHSCIGSVAGIYTASMPVLVVRDETYGGTAYCNLYEGKSPKRLNYGSYDAEVEQGLRWLGRTMAPVLAECLRRRPIRLKPLMARALRLGDELHSRNTAASMLLERELRTALFDLDKTEMSPLVREVVGFLDENDYTFLRVGMAAAKATADAAHGVPFSSLVTGMALNCREFAVRVSGLGDQWFRGTHPTMEGRFFEGFSEQDAEWIGGESCVTETIGLGGFAQVCAPTLLAYQGGTVEAMRQNNLAMYDITVGEHPNFRLPPLDFRGSPVGIDIFKVMATGTTPVIDGGLAGRDGGQIGAGVLRPHLDAFERATTTFMQQYDGAR
jgi:hypothetical protein